MCFLWPPYGIGQAIIFFALLFLSFLSFLFLMAVHCNGQANIFLPCGFFFCLLLLSLFSSPNLSGRRLDVYRTSTHGVALVRI